MTQRENIEFVVGEEKSLIELLSGTDVMPLLAAACRAGASRAEVRDAGDAALWDFGLSVGPVGTTSWPGFITAVEPLMVEGEPLGQVWLIAPENCEKNLPTIALLVGSALNTIVTSNLKRMLTTEIHTQVINQNFDDLLATNARLVESERNYRELAENLEERVKQRTAELKQAYAELVAQQQMATIGQLAAGVAHEINNPLGFIHSNLFSLQTYLGRIVDMLQAYRHPVQDKGADGQDVDALWKKLKIDYILDDIGDLFSESIEGAERVKTIVSDLKGFSHIDALGPESIDLAGEVDRALALLAHEVPDGTRVERHFQSMEPVHCMGAQLSQVLLNLLRNALQSRSEGLVLVLSLGHDDDQLWLSVADNGPGIPAELQQRIFEPFFTTRDVGSGAGLGLTVVHNILEQWGGTIQVSSSDLGGACLTLRWPQGRVDG